MRGFMVNRHLLFGGGFLLTVFSLGLFLVDVHAFGVKKKRPKLHEYGNVVINNYSEKKNIAPVVFKHWLHRVKYTCRLCHVDIGFAMYAGDTGITEEYNETGFYCGACHNGKEAFGPHSIGELQSLHLGIFVVWFYDLQEISRPDLLAAFLVEEGCLISAFRLRLEVFRHHAGVIDHRDPLVRGINPVLENNKDDEASAHEDRSDNQAD